MGAKSTFEILKTKLEIPIHPDSEEDRDGKMFNKS